MVAIFDCESHDSALWSVAMALDLTTDRVAEWLDGLDIDAAFAEPTPFPGHADEYLRSVVPCLSAAARRVETVAWFHTTRAADPDVFFRDGLLPLTRAANCLWAFLQRVAGARISSTEWHAIRESVDRGVPRTPYADRLAFRDGVDHGPCAFLVRESAVSPPVGQINLMARGSELMQDACAAIAELTGVDLYGEALASTVPCVVKFTADADGQDVIAAALLYLWAARRQREFFTCVLGGSYDARGRAISRERILAVQPLPGSPSAVRRL